MNTCKHGNIGNCALCDHEDAEHDAAMAAQADAELAALRRDAGRWRAMREPDTMSREALEAAAYDCLTALAGVETYDINLRDLPQAWEAIEAFAAAAQADAYERIAQIFDRRAKQANTPARMMEAQDDAYAIRALANGATNA